MNAESTPEQVAKKLKEKMTESQQIALLNGQIGGLEAYYYQGQITKDQWQETQDRIRKIAQLLGIEKSVNHV